MSGLDRTQIIRIDCPTCKGNGYTTKAGQQEACEVCGGTGLREKEVEYKFDTHGHHTREELAEAFEVSVDDVHDGGHSVGD